MLIFNWVLQSLKQAVCWHAWRKEKIVERYEDGPNNTLFKVVEIDYKCEKCGKIEKDKTLKLA